MLSTGRNASTLLTCSLACRAVGYVIVGDNNRRCYVSELRRQAASVCHEQVGPVEPVEPVEQVEPVGEAVQMQFEQFGQFERVGQEDMQEDMLLSEIMRCAVCVGVIWGLAKVPLFFVGFYGECCRRAPVFGGVFPPEKNSVFPRAVGFPLVVVCVVLQMFEHPLRLKMLRAR